jgi:HPt (histidine-containing phosphotransfer) domain-containing protein
MATLSAAVQSGDALTTYRMAHTIKGSVMNFGAEPTRMATLELEMKGRHNQMADAQAAYDRLVPLMNELTAALGAFKP